MWKTLKKLTLIFLVIISVSYWTLITARASEPIPLATNLATNNQHLHFQGNVAKFSSNRIKCEFLGNLGTKNQEGGSIFSNGRKCHVKIEVQQNILIEQ